MDFADQKDLETSVIRLERMEQQLRSLIFLWNKADPRGFVGRVKVVASQAREERDRISKVLLRLSRPEEKPKEKLEDVINRYQQAAHNAEPSGLVRRKKSKKKKAEEPGQGAGSE